MKIEMPKLKRCKLEEPNSEGDSGIQKKRKVKDAGDISSGSGSLSSEVSHLGGGNGGGGEVQSNSNSAQLNGKTAKDRCSAAPRPPLLRSSRGRLQMLPSRFSDSVIDTWKNGGGIKTEVESFEEDETKSDDGIGIGLKNSVCYPCAAEVKAVVAEERTVVKTESNSSGLSFEGVDQNQKPNNGDNAAEKKRKEVYKPEDFALGDIVWAKCGKRYPAWPAVVIDPILEAPKSVLSCCVPGALCVMFFGYSKNGTQRVK